MLLNVREALAALEQRSASADAALLLLAAAACCLLWPAWRSLHAARGARTALREGEVVEARVRTSAARNVAMVACGYAAAQFLALLAIEFLVANNLAVSRTFFYLPLIQNSFVLILHAFWINVYIFMISEVLARLIHRHSRDSLAGVV